MLSSAAGPVFLSAGALSSLALPCGLGVPPSPDKPRGTFGKTWINSYSKDKTNLESRMAEFGSIYFV
jgi:hypothetical protein